MPKKNFQQRKLVRLTTMINYKLVTQKQQQQKIEKF